MKKEYKKILQEMFINDIEFNLFYKLFDKYKFSYDGYSIKEFKKYVELNTNKYIQYYEIVNKKDLKKIPFEYDIESKYKDYYLIFSK